MKYLFFILLVIGFNSFSYAEIDEFRVVALSPQDNRAVIRLSDDRVSLVNVGDTLFDTKVLQVLSDKLVLKDNSGELIWVFKSENNQVSRVQRFHRSLPESEITIVHQIAE